MALPKVAQVQTSDRVLGQIQSNILNSLNIVVANPIINGILLQGIDLAVGDNTINHKLGRTLVGWFVTRLDAVSSIYDKQSTNPMPDRTLILNSSAICTVDLYVF